MTTTIVTRAGKGAELTWSEVDANFTNLRATADGAISPVTTSSDLSVATSSELIRFSGTVTPRTFTLPAASGSGKKYFVKHVGKSGIVLTISASPGHFIDGVVSITLSNKYQSVTLADSSSGNWDVL